jgi:hypothetical protein
MMTILVAFRAAVRAGIAPDQFWRMTPFLLLAALGIERKKPGRRLDR